MTNEVTIVLMLDKLIEEGKKKRPVLQAENNKNGWDKNDMLWEERYNELIKFKKKFGHCNPIKKIKKYAKLSNWVIKQRWDKKQNRNWMTEYKISKLNELDFDWGYSRQTWDEHFDELVLFYQKHGHTDVPKKDKKYSTLYNWVIRQRSSKFVLTKEQVGKLDKIDFMCFPKQKLKIDYNQFNIYY